MIISIFMIYKHSIYNLQSIIHNELRKWPELAHNVLALSGKRGDVQMVLTIHPVTRLYVS